MVSAPPLALVLAAMADGVQAVSSLVGVHLFVSYQRVGSGTGGKNANVSVRLPSQHFVSVLRRNPAMHMASAI